jgi:hypothetical protein
MNCCSPTKVKKVMASVTKAKEYQKLKIAAYAEEGSNGDG